MKIGKVKTKYKMALMVAILLTLFCVACVSNGKALNGNIQALVAPLNKSDNIAETLDASIAGNIVVPKVLTRDYIYLQEPTCVAVYQDYYAVCDKIGSSEYAVIIVNKDGDMLSMVKGFNNVEKMAMADNKILYVKSGDELIAIDFANLDNPTITVVTDFIVDGVFDIFADDGEVFVQNYNNSVFSFKKVNASYELTPVVLLKSYVANSIVRFYNGKFYSYRYTDETIYELTPNAEDDTKFVKISSGLTDLSDYCIVKGTAAVLNKSKNKVVLESEIKEGKSSLSLACSNDVLVIGDSNGRSIETYDKALTPIKKLASISADQGKLNAPESIAVYDEAVLIGDSGNNRVAKYNSQGELIAEYNMQHSVKTITACKDGFYVIADSEIYKYIYNSVGGVSLVGEAIAINGIIDIAVWENNLIGLKTNGEVYDFANGKTLFVLSGANKIVLNSHTNILYALSPTKLARFNLGNKLNIEEYSHTMNGYIDFSVDFSGKIYAYYGDRIECYGMDKRLLKLELNNVYTLDGMSNTYSVAQSHNGNVFIAERGRHALMKIEAKDIDAYSIYDYQTPTNWDVVRGAEYNAGALLYVVPGNGETASNAEFGARFLCLANETADGNDYYYGMDVDSGSFYFVSVNDIKLLDFFVYNESVPKYNSILAIGVEVYEFPFADAKVQNKADFGTLFTLINNVAGSEEDLSWGWYKVAYTIDGKAYEGYVKRIDVSPYSPLLPPAKQEYYKVKADNVGVTVNVYGQAAADSAVLFTLNDGESVIVMSDQFDSKAEFTRIYVNGKYGYIRTANLIKDGLTTVEITAVIVGSICGAALLGTIPLFFMLYKKHRAQKTRVE